MPRHHTIWDAATQQQIDVPFTLEEEAARDVEEAKSQEEMAARDVVIARKEVLEAKLKGDTITSAEIREMLRLERGL